LSRASWFVGRLAGFCGVALFLALITCVPLAFMLPLERLWPWGVSLVAELSLLACASLTVAISVRQVTAAALAVGLFYVLCRAIDAMVLITRGPTIDTQAWTSWVIAQAVETLSFLLPALYRFTQSAWLRADLPPSLTPILLQTAIYMLLLCALGLFDSYRVDD